jgi:hypothetical protein
MNVKGRECKAYLEEDQYGANVPMDGKTDDVLWHGDIFS